MSDDAADLLPTVWIMKTYDGHFYPIQPSTQCKAEDHGNLNNHIASIEDDKGNVIWERNGR